MRNSAIEVDKEVADKNMKSWVSSAFIHSFIPDISFCNRKSFMSCCIMPPHFLLLLSSTVASIALCCYNSFHAVFVPSQSGLLYFVSNARHPQHLSDDLIPFLILQ